MSPRSGLSSLLIVLFGMLSPSAPFAKPASDGKIPVTTKSDAARAAYLEGRDLLEKLRGADARDHFKRAVELDPSFAMALLQLSFTQPTVRQFNETIAQASAASAGVSKGERLLIEAGVAGGNGDNAAQCRLLKESTVAYPNDERAWTQYGNALFAMQDWTGSVKAFEAAIKVAPAYSPPYNQLGYAYRFLGQMDKAEATFKKYVELLPDDPNPYDSYAELLLKRGRYDESIATYRKALEVDPHFVASYVGIATGYDLLHRPKEALAEADKLLAVAKDDGQRRAAYFSRVVSYAHGGDYSNAARELWHEYEIAQASGDTLNMAADKIAMGNIALEQNDAAAAEKLFAEAQWLIRSGEGGPAGEPRESGARPEVPERARRARAQRRGRREEVERHVRRRGQRLGQRGPEASRARAGRPGCHGAEAVRAARLRSCPRRTSRIRTTCTGSRSPTPRPGMRRRRRSSRRRRRATTRSTASTTRSSCGK
jgi:tetratricopeptide (TPR) repeat protein